MSNLLFAIGVIVVIFTGASVLFTIVLPREPKGFQRVSVFVLRVVQLAFIGLSRVARSYEGKDALLAPTAPVALVAQLTFWAGCFIVGFGLMLERTTHDLVSALAQATGSVFTVGTINLSGRPNRAVDIAAGATWVVIVALQIAYLPALYQAFNRRESLVAMLESRAGVPAWGPEVLARHQLVGIIDTLPEFYSSWEGWSAELAESHTTYPVLLAGRTLGSSRWRRDAPGPGARYRLVSVAVVPPHGVHRTESRGQGPAVGSGPGPRSRRRHQSHLR
jgi:hypothetical protein